MNSNTFFLLLFCLAQPFLGCAFQCTDSSSSMTLTGTAAQFIIGTNMTFSGSLKVPTYVPGVSIVQSGSGNSITFPTNSSVLFGGIPISITGAYTPSGQSSFNMTGSQSLVIGDGTIAMPVNVSGTSNAILGTALISQPITLANSSTTLSLGLTNGLAGNLVLSSGVVTLLSHLPIKQGAQITGPGSINCNGFSIFFPEYLSALTTSLTFTGSVNTLVLSRKMLLTGIWTFSGATSIIRGDGAILDLTGGGRLAIGSGSSLYLSGVHIKGLGVLGSGNITFGSSTSKLYLSNCTLELAGNYSQSQGQVFIEGSKCLILVDSTECYIVSGSTSVLTIDGQILSYRVTSGSSFNPVAAISSGTINKLNGGDIRSDDIRDLDYLSFSADTNSLTSNLELSSQRSIFFQNLDLWQPKNMVLDGNNNTIVFGEGDSQPFIVQEAITLTVQNVKFQNFDPAKILLQGSGDTQATINFGDGVVFEFSKNLTLQQTRAAVLNSYTLDIVGSVELRGIGLGCRLELWTGALNLLSERSIVTFRNLQIKTFAPDAIKVSSNLAKIILQGVSVCISSVGLIFDNGDIEFKDNVDFFAANEIEPEGAAEFIFTSSGSLTLMSNSMVTFNPDFKFLYRPNVEVDRGDIFLEKRHFKLSDPSSTLKLKHAYIDSGPTGLAFDYGKIIVEEMAYFNTSFEKEKSLEIGSAVNLMVLNTGNMVVNGLIMYTPTTYSFR